MSEITARYMSALPVTVEAFRNRPCSLPITDPNYVPPTPEEVRALRQLLGFTQSRVGALVGRSYNKKGCKSVRRWENNIESKEYQPINYSAWQLMLLAAEVIFIDEIVEASERYKVSMN
ncbi:hypothetical protein GNP73_08155 [Aliivibrio fischeri]|uniref:helix-turn-helix domain-containing protein n=1 Tax=Aliivibrio fischeri TaxID=668 RepID=UPI0012DAE045|nr:hypothetical protein [Aliivibrio fischeri]MUJ27947.1 hypothetical protein [Aliivibrio fischeri]